MSATRRLLGLLGLLCVLGTRHPGALANPIDLYGIGSRQIAMAGAATALADDSSANYYNPAGLVVGRDLKIDLGYRWARPVLRMNGHDAGVDDARGFSMGLVAPAAIGKFRFAFGIGLWLPDQRLTRVRTLSYEQPRFLLYDNLPQRILFSANLAIQIVPGLYIGGGLSYMSRTRGTVLLKGSVAVSDPDASALTSKIDVDLVAVRYPQFGILWQPNRNLSFGLSYRHSFYLQMDQSFRIDGDIGNPGLPPVVQGGYFAARALAADLFQPWQLSFGAAARLLRRLWVAFDLSYVRWSEFRDPASKIEVSLDIGSFNGLVNLPVARKHPPPGLRDLVVPRLGVEWRALVRGRLSMDLRAGYSYEASPVPEQTGESNYADSDRHGFALGLGLELERMGNIVTKPWGIDVHGAVTYLPTRANHKLDPRDRFGDLRVDGVVVQLGLQLRSRF